jgi:hypothetical protein
LNLNNVEAGGNSCTGSLSKHLHHSFELSKLDLTVTVAIHFLNDFIYLFVHLFLTGFVALAVRLTLTDAKDGLYFLWANRA